MVKVNRTVIKDQSEDGTGTFFFHQTFHNVFPSSEEKDQEEGGDEGEERAEDETQEDNDDVDEDVEETFDPIITEEGDDNNEEGNDVPLLTDAVEEFENEVEENVGEEEDDENVGIDEGLLAA